MAKLGYNHREVLKGTLRFVEEPEEERAVRLDVEMTLSDWREVLVQGIAPLSGSFSCEGFAANAPAAGKIRFDALKREVLTYDLHFSMPDRGHVRLVGEKRLDLMRPTQMVTTLHARVEEDEKLIATGTLHLELKDIWDVVKSIRPLINP